MMDKNAANTHVLVVQVEPVVKKTHRHVENDTNTS